MTEPWTTRAEWPEYEVRHAPGWLIDDAVSRAVAADLARALPSLKMADYFAVKPETFAAADHVAVAFDREDRAIGALASRWHTLGTGERYVHVLAAFVGEDYQGSDLVWHLWALHWQEACPTARACPSLVAFRTYNPRSCRALQGFARIEDAAFYPRIPATAQDPRLADVAQRLAAALSPGNEFDPATGVIRGGGGAVPADFYPTLQLTSSDVTNDHFRRYLGAADRLLCVLDLPTPEARRRFVEASATGIGPRALVPVTV